MENFKNTIKDILESEPIKESLIKLVNIGAEKMVFETPGSNKKVIKVDIDYIKEKYQLFLVNNLLIKNGIDDELEEKIRERKEVEFEISGIFGEEHLLRNGIFKVKVPISKDAIIKIFGKEYESDHWQLEDGVVYEIEILAETQLKAGELADREVFKTLSFDTDLITDDNFRNAENISNALSLIRKFIDEQFISKFEGIDNDEEFKNIIKEILSKITKYIKKTGRMIDIFGPDNLTIFKNKDGKLDYHLLDVVLPGNQKYWSVNIKDDKELNLLRHAYTFYYAVKTLADNVGMVDSLEPEDLHYFKNSGIPKEGKIPKRITKN